MRFTRARIFLTAGTLAAAGAMAGAVITALPASAGTATTQVSLINYCNHHGNVRPATEDLPGCMTSSEFLSGLKWTSWRSVAYGSGVFRVNNCTPSSSCGPSMFSKYPILTVLWRAEPWPGHSGHKYFSRLTVIFDGKAHPHGPSAQTIILPAR
jgi:hypothetical protein